MVNSKDKKKPLLDIDVSREELEETGCHYKRVIKMLDRVDNKKMYLCEKETITNSLFFNLKIHSKLTCQFITY
ncbi:MULTISPECIES: DUF5839 family protein [Bacillus]|uniref:DUF5839 family protein n=1 Tax=Bacillus TaxID=1386 RepID=UPI0032EF59F5